MGRPTGGRHGQVQQPGSVWKQIVVIGALALAFTMGFAWLVSDNVVSADDMLKAVKKDEGHRTQHKGRQAPSVSTVQTSEDRIFAAELILGSQDAIHFVQALERPEYLAEITPFSHHLISLNLFNNLDVIPALADSLEVYIGRYLLNSGLVSDARNIVVSIFENGSNDDTPVQVLALLAPRLFKLGVRVQLTVNGTCCGGFSKKPKTMDRIKWMACVRNAALAPLLAHSELANGAATGAGSEGGVDLASVFTHVPYFVPIKGGGLHHRPGDFSTDGAALGGGEEAEGELDADAPILPHEVEVALAALGKHVVSESHREYRLQEAQRWLDSKFRPVGVAPKRRGMSTAEATGGDGDGDQVVALDLLGAQGNPHADAKQEFSSFLDAAKLSVTFLNDIFFAPEDLLRLVFTKQGQYDMACPLDFYETFYDTWVSRDIDGRAFQAGYPYAVNPKTIASFRKNEPAQVKCCWNGVAVFPGSSFVISKDLKESLRLNEERSKLIIRHGGGTTNNRNNDNHNENNNNNDKDFDAGDAYHRRGFMAEQEPAAAVNPRSAGRSHKEMAALEFRANTSATSCYSSECQLLCEDLLVQKKNRIFVNPQVKVAYEKKYFDLHHSSPVDIVSTVRRWATSTFSGGGPGTSSTDPSSIQYTEAGLECVNVNRVFTRKVGTHTFLWSLLGLVGLGFLLFQVMRTQSPSPSLLARLGHWIAGSSASARGKDRYV